MAYISGRSREQLILPLSLEDLIAKDHPVRVIDAFVDHLDLAALGFIHAAPAHTGRPAYAPAVLLKLYLYGYFHHIRSSRDLMAECRRNIELFYLLQCLTPDFRTIADFRKDNAHAITQVFHQFSKLCRSCRLFSDEFAVDGSKFRAQNGRKRMYNQEILETKRKRIEAQIADYLRQMEQWDEAEDREAEARQELEAALKELSKRKEQYLEYLARLEEGEGSQLLTTDPEARMMNSKDGFHCCYNVQTAVDTRSHLIASYQVTNHANDQQLLSSFAQSLKDERKAETPKEDRKKEETISIIADKGYDSRDEILSCVYRGILPYVGFRYDQKERILILPYEPQEISEQRRSSTKPKDIQACLKAGILPRCYENTHLSVELHSEQAIGCFHRGLDQKTVTCPMGFTLSRIRIRPHGVEYACKPACRQCTNRCTASKHHKVVLFAPGTEYVAARMYGKDKPLITQPPGFLPHNSFYSKNKPPVTVLLRIADDIPRQRLRLCVSEHPFGTVKWSHGAHYFLCRGIQKTSAEAGLSFLAYNMKRAINLMGVPALLEAIERS